MDGVGVVASGFEHPGAQLVEIDDWHCGGVDFDELAIDHLNHWATEVEVEDGLGPASEEGGELIDVEVVLGSDGVAAQQGAHPPERLQEQEGPVGGGVDRRVDVDGDSELGCGGGVAVGAVGSMGRSVRRPSPSRSAASLRLSLPMSTPDTEVLRAMSPPSSLSSIDSQRRPP